MSLPQGPNPLAPMMYMIPKAFDAGAKFDGIAKPHIPPPSPGGVPNAAQLTVALGRSVVLGQKNSSVIVEEVQSAPLISIPGIKSDGQTFLFFTPLYQVEFIKYTSGSATVGQELAVNQKKKSDGGNPEDADA